MAHNPQNDRKTDGAKRGIFGLIAVAAGAVPCLAHDLSVAAPPAHAIVRELA